MTLNEFISLFPVGKECAVTVEDLKTATGCSDWKVFDMVRLARKNGAVILSTIDGTNKYYRPAENGTGVRDLIEWLLFVADMRLSTHEYYTITSNARALLEKLEEQDRGQDIESA